MKTFLLLLVLILFPFSAGFAAKVTSLYQAELAISAQTDDLKAKAIKSGFLQMLIKLTGDPQITTNPVIKDELNRADYYVQEFSYSPSTTDSQQFHIRIHYDAEDVNRLLKRAGVAYWGETRPLILVWLAVTHKRTPPDIISSEVRGDLLSLMKQQSKRYGLPLIFPMMDVADVEKVSPDDVVDVTLPALQDAAKRYSPDALLIGQIDQQPEGVASQWQLIVNDNQWKWAFSSKTTNDVIASIMNQVSQTLAKHYIVKNVDIQQQWLKLEVMNVTEREDLNHLLNYLKQLTQVQDVRLLEISSDVVELSILVRGSLEGFKKNAAIGQRLSLKYQDRVDNKLIYVWIH